MRAGALRPGSRIAATVVAAVVLLSPGPEVQAAAIPAPPAASPIGVTPSTTVQAPPGPPSGGPLLAEAMSVYQTMTQTRYQTSQYVISPATGVYYWDCVGFVDWALRQATPNAEAAMREALGIRTGYVPTPTQLAGYLTGSPSASWQPITNVSQLVGGEVMVIPGTFSSGGTSYSGHATVVAGPALPMSDGSYAVFVYDSTALPGHGAFDSRLTDARALPLQGSTTRFSGTGYGTMRLTVDVAGAPVNAFWTAASTSPMGTTVVLARPLD